MYPRAYYPTRYYPKRYYPLRPPSSAAPGYYPLRYYPANYYPKRYYPHRSAASGGIGPTLFASFARRSGPDPYRSTAEPS